MQVTVSARHIGVTEAQKSYCQEKASRLERFYNRIQSIEVVLDGNAGKHTAEVIVHTERSQPFVAKEENEDLYAAIDILVDKIERQLRDHKEKLRNRKHPRRSTPEDQTP
ncbi:MAG: ribosome-associated translation inhibitor RaiA [Planctomycetes bacterium]|nr:ribosome-associated translation inhibitor RaiA [Planctomycetota bacterium]